MTRNEFYYNLLMFKKRNDKELKHYGILGQKWGTRRWQNADGTFNEEGKIRYFGKVGSTNKKNNSDGTYKKNKIDFDWDMQNHLDKYTIEELKNKVEELANKRNKIKEENEKIESEIYSKMYKVNESDDKGAENYHRKRNEVMNDYLYVKTKNAEKFAKKDGKDWNTDIFIQNYLGEEGEAFEYHDDDEWNKWEKLSDKTWNETDKEKKAKLREIEQIQHWTNYLNQQYAEKEILENTAKELKEKNYKIDDKEKMEYAKTDNNIYDVIVTKDENGNEKRKWIKKDIPEWEYMKYKDENGKEHIGLEQEYDTDYGKFKVRIKHNRPIDARYNVNDTDEIVYKQLPKVEEKAKQYLLENLWIDKWSYFKQFYNEDHYPYVSEKQKKYIYEMSKDDYMKALEKNVLPKIKMEIKDFDYDKNNGYKFKFNLDLNGEKLDCYTSEGGGVNVPYPDRSFKLDDLLD